jgi:hypothetical protein
MKNRVLLPIIALLITSISVTAQTAEIRGSIIDSDVDEPLEMADVLLYQLGEIVNARTTDSAGKFAIPGIRPGTYTFTVLYLDKTLHTEIVTLSQGEVLNRYNLKLSTTEAGGFDLDPFSKRFIESEDEDVSNPDDIIKFKPTPEIIRDLKPNVQERNGRLVVGPHRPDATKGFLGSNVPLIGGGPKVLIGLAAVEVMDRGISARYGNFTGGGLQYNTKVIGPDPESMLQLQSSSPFNGYHHNLGILYLSRALKLREVETPKGNTKETVFGFSLLGTYKFQADPLPSVVNPFVIDQHVLGDIEQNPLVTSQQIGGYVPTATYLDESMLNQRQARPNAQRHDGSVRLKLSYNPSQWLSVDFINTFDYTQRRLSQANNVLMNSHENPTQRYTYINSQLQLAHKVKSEYDNYGNRVDSSEGLISRLSYLVDLNYQQTNSSIFNHRHKENLFDYGYVGRFKTIQVPQYAYVEDGDITYVDEDGNKRTLTTYHELTGYRDSLLGFEGGDANPALADYTSFIYNQLLDVNSVQDIVSRGGVLNGQNLPTLYSLYSNPGTVYGSYSKSFQKRFSISAYTEFSIHPFKNNRDHQHDFEVGMSFMQDVSGYYNLSAGRLWQLMPLLANSHLQNVDVNEPIIRYDDQGRFIDTVIYPVYVDLENQKTFDKNLRDKLIEQGYRDADGKLIDETTRIDVNTLSPDVFDLSMFSADELLNNGNSYVGYAGYDHLGNRVRRKQGLQEFLTNKEQRPMDAFAPITAAAWIQDKVVLKDMVIRAGVRFERYDGNQMVLKDPYSIYPIKHVSEVQEIQGREVNHPESVDGDFAVYVDNADNPNRIVGYRDGSDWYDADGIQVTDPNVLANESSSGRIQPYLLDPENQELTRHSFKSFKAQNMVLPRISLSFPINTTSLFFMSYDQLAQNPSMGQTFLPYTTYYYMQSNISGVLPNPELKARVKTEYNIGFKQAVGLKSTVKLWASYANVANDFNLFRIEQAYPYSYTTYSNVDFATIKRYVMEYEHISRRINITGSYALQFAEGTGSNANSAASLIQSGQPNLRSLFPLAYDTRHTLKGGVIYNFGSVLKRKDLAPYVGPVLFGKPILANTYISMNFQSLSGEPYSAIQRAISSAQAANGVVQRAQTKGNPFGSRMPWTHNVNIQINKSFAWKERTMSAYILIDNVLNNLLVQNVYPYTGQAGDDGYLNSPHGRQQAESQIDAQTFAMLYRIRMNNPGNFGTPRMINMGLKMEF